MQLTYQNNLNHKKVKIEEKPHKKKSLDITNGWKSRGLRQQFDTPWDDN